MTLTGQVLAKYRNPVFCETGTFLGGAVEIAVALGFQAVHTIDLVRAHAEAVRARFPRVNAVCGDSRRELPRLLAEIDRPATFWLDAHRHYADQDGDSPVPAELDAIAEWWRPGSVVLIDDVRLFGVEQSPWGGSCSFERLLGKAGQLARRHGLSIAFEHSKVAPADILVLRGK